MTTWELPVIWLCSLVTFWSVPLINCDVPPSHYHGPIVMGIPNDNCDNAQWRLWVDWRNDTDADYRCQANEQRIPVTETAVLTSCLKNEDIPEPIHICMTRSIEYEDRPPRGGPHRPLWPVYGEYLYLPPQRWVHSLEHGAIVMLYHPCADRREVDLLRQVVTSCLRRHVITPSRQLSRYQPLALLTYGCKLTMNKVNVEAAEEFILENAFNPQRTTEADNWMDGQYTAGLIMTAEIPRGSNIRDDHLCPNTNDEILENMLLQDLVREMNL